MKIQLKNVRLSFPDLFKKGKPFGDAAEGAFGATFLIDRDDPELATIRSAIKELVKNELKGAKLSPDKVCLRDGNDKDYKGFEGTFYLNARNKIRPTVVNRDRSPITEEDGIIYAGCYVNAIVDLWAMDNQFGKRINASLLGVQFFKDGEAFSGGISVSKSDDFEELEPLDEAENSDNDWM